MNATADHPLPSSEAHVPLPDESLPSLADTCVIFPHAPRAVVPVVLGELELLEYHLYQTLVIVC
jgi:hypothetical protein